jgi:DNA-binding HxlR family transcriptional regulator
MASKRRDSFNCPIDVTLKLIRGKWKPMILWQLSAERRRFSQLQIAMPQVAHKVLSEQLRQLQTDGLIRRVVGRPSDGATAYELTDFGRTLRPALNALAVWGKAHRPAKND